MQDLLLGHLLLDGQGQGDLAQLASHGGLAGGVDEFLVAGLAAGFDEGVAHVLLGEGRRTLQWAAGDVVDHRAHDARRVHAVVLEEALVLDRHHRVAHRLVDPVHRDDDPVLRVEARHERPVGPPHDGLLGRLGQGDLLGEFPDHLLRRVRHRPHGRRRRDQQAGQQHAAEAGRQDECQQHGHDLLGLRRCGARARAGGGGRHESQGTWPGWRTVGCDDHTTVTPQPCARARPAGTRRPPRRVLTTCDTARLADFVRKWTRLCQTRRFRPIVIEISYACVGGDGAATEAALGPHTRHWVGRGAGGRRG